MMLTAPIPATRRVLAKTGLAASAIDHFEVNEAFACGPLAGQREFAIDPARLNPCGGAIAIGHPLGASCARLMTTMLHALERSGGRWPADHVRGRRHGQRHDHRTTVGPVNTTGPRRLTC